MFILELFDRLGQKLSQGDIVKISDGRHFKFYAEVKWLEQEQVIAPFDIENVNGVIYLTVNSKRFIVKPKTVIKDGCYKV